MGICLFEIHRKHRACHNRKPAVLPVIPWFVKFQVLSSGRGVLDVAGGQGDLSWQLSTLLSLDDFR